MNMEHPRIHPNLSYPLRSKKVSEYYPEQIGDVGTNVSRQRELLEECLSRTVNTSMNPEDLKSISDPQLLKLFELSQHSLKYLLHVQNNIINETQFLDQAYKESENELHLLEKKAEENQRSIEKYKEEIRRRRSNVKVNEKDVRLVIHKCHFCKKCFESGEFLDKHIQRRHSIGHFETETTSNLNKKPINDVTVRDSMKQVKNHDNKEDSREAMNDIRIVATVHEVFKKVREEGQRNFDKMDQMYSNKIKEVLQSNLDITQRLQIIGQKVDNSTIRQSLSHVSMDENQELQYYEQENSNLNSNSVRNNNGLEYKKRMSKDNSSNTYISSELKRTDQTEHPLPEDLEDNDSQNLSFEDEDERERTIRILESSVGIRGDEDEALEKNIRAFIKARNKFQQLTSSPSNLTEETKTKMKKELQNSFKLLFGSDYETLAGQEVMTLEEITNKMQLLNNRQKERVKTMKEDFEKMQSRGVLNDHF